MNREKIHQGHNVRHFREMRHMSQDTLARKLSGGWTQEAISLLEEKEVIEPGVIKEISAALALPAEAIRNLDEMTAVSIIAHAVAGRNASGPIDPYCAFNPFDKVIELYVRMLTDKDEMINRLEKLIEKIR